MCYVFVLKNVINSTHESRTAWSVNHYTRSKYIFHTERNIFFRNIYKTFDHKTFNAFRIKNVNCPHVQNSSICFDVFFVQGRLNIVVEVFRCSTIKENTLSVCSAKSSIQIPNIYTHRYAVTKNYYVVIDIAWYIIVSIRVITVCRDNALATFIYLVVYINFHIVR